MPAAMHPVDSDGKTKDAIGIVLELHLPREGPSAFLRYRGGDE